MVLRFGILACLLAACTGPGGRKEDKPAHRSDEDQRKYEAAVQRGEVKYGMTKSEVERAWGAPLRKDKVKYRDRQVARWSYQTREVYFDQGGFVIRFRGY